MRKLNGPLMPNRFLWTPLSPAQTFLRLQFPFLVGVVVLSTATATAVPSLWADPALFVGVAFSMIASALFLVPGREWLNTGWIIAVPLIDIMSIAIVRATLIPYLPTVGMLCLFPFAWIAYRFRWPALLVVLGGGVFIGALPFALGATAVATLLAALNVATLPLIATGISVAIHIGAIQFRKGREKVEDTTHKLQRSLAASQDDRLLLRSVLDTINGAVAFYDADNRLMIANSTAEQMVHAVGFRLDAPPYAGRNVLMSDRKTPIPFEEQIIPRALRGDVIASHIEWIGVPGDQVAILASSRRVHRTDGQLLGTVIAAYDVTELANAIEIREEFLTTVSHELRTPLTSIIGYTDIVIDTLEEQSHDLGVSKALETISRNAHALLERVGQLLDASNRHIELHVSPTDITRLVADVTSPLALPAQRAGITLTVHSDENVFAELDRARITQAVENLLTNAIKFTGRGGAITVTTTLDDSRNIHIAVRDTGIGMTPDEQRRIFDRFYRSQTVRQDAIQGIGVGLSITHAIITAHRGRITVDSSPGKGTIITLCIPQRHDTPDPARENS